MKVIGKYQTKQGCNIIDYSVQNVSFLCEKKQHFCMDVAMCDPVHDVDTIHWLW